MVEGVTKGYEKRLKIEGIGYQAAGQESGRADGRLCQPRSYDAAGRRDGRGARIRPRSSSRERTSRRSASSPPRFGRVRKPEPYKGKGIRYENEVVRRKEGKSFASGGDDRMATVRMNRQVVNRI